MKTSHADFHWYFTFGDDDVPAARAVEDVFMHRVGMPQFVDHVTVTVYLHCDEPSTVRAEGRPFTKKGALDRRVICSGLVAISDEDEARFIALAESLLAEGVR